VLIEAKEILNQHAAVLGRTGSVFFAVVRTVGELFDDF
jgi:hypothetical protein